MTGEVNPYRPPETHIVSPIAPRRRPFLRWSGAILSGLGGLFVLYVAWFIAELVMFKVGRIGWGRLFFEGMGPARSMLFLGSFLMTVGSGVLFFVASRYFVIGRIRRALIVFLAAFGAGCLLPFLFQ